MITPLRRHPSPLMLKRLADGESPADGRVAAHVERCGRCGETVAFHRRVSAIAGSPSPAPSLPEGMLGRILAERAAGERALLPAEDERASWPWAGRAGAAALAAAAVVALVLAARDGGAPGDVPRGGVPGLGLLPTPIHAQQVNPGPRFPAPVVDGRRIRPGVWALEYRVSRGGRLLEPAERGEVRVTAARTGRGVPAWRMTSAWLGHADDIRETVDFDAATLRPLHRSASNVGPSRYVVEQWVRGDSLHGTMSSEIRRTRTRIARYLPPREGPYLAGESSPLLLFQGVQLRPGWRARVALLGWGSVTSDLMYPVSLRVTGQRHLRGPLGRAECWTVEAAFGRRTRTLWVRKRDGVTLLSREVSPQGVLTEVVLVRETPVPR